jgi:hypothetical protein
MACRAQSGIHRSHPIRFELAASEVKVWTKIPPHIRKKKIFGRLNIRSIMLAIAGNPTITKDLATPCNPYADDRVLSLIAAIIPVIQCTVLRVPIWPLPARSSHSHMPRSGSNLMLSLQWLLIPFWH